MGCRPATDRGDSSFDSHVVSPLEGNPASLRPGLRTASRATRNPVRQSHRVPICAMSDHATGDELRGARLDLAVAVAHGRAIKSWADAHNTPLQTAHEWANQPDFKRAVSRFRRRSADLAAGRLASYATKAAQVMTDLAVSAASESVKLAACRAILSDMMTVSEYTDLELRMTDIEEQLRERTGNEDQAR
jgi:hypothetical protein